MPPGAFVVAPTGTISLFSSFNGGPATLLAQFPVGGSAIFPVFTVPGTYDLFVTFDSADGNFNGSTSNSITIAVLSAGSCVLLLSPSSPAAASPPADMQALDSFFANNVV